MLWGRGVGCRVVRLCVALLLYMPSLRASAQETTFTLHVYTNLFQIPTLVLGERLEQLPLIDPKRFTIRIDTQREFAPRHVRIEGEDPISLAVLMDASGSQNKLLTKLPESLSSLVSESLHPQDIVHLYALDCHLLMQRTPPGADGARIAEETRNLLNSPQLHPPSQGRKGCNASPHFYDSLLSLINAMSTFPGRRVLVILTDGFDYGSKSSIGDVIYLATSRGVTIFGIDSSGLSFDLSHTRDAAPRLCNSTGGLFMGSSEKGIDTALKHVIDLVRGRYILEFQRPGNMTSGRHFINIRVAKMSEARIYPAGTSAPIADPKSPDDLASEPTPPPSTAPDAKSAVRPQD